jgi:hypothetical protein
MKDAKNSMRLVSFSHQVLISQSVHLCDSPHAIMPTKKDLDGLWTKKKMFEDYRPLNLVTP